MPRRAAEVAGHIAGLAMAVLFLVAPQNVGALSLIAVLNASVPLDHCVWLGPRSEYLFEWQLSEAPKYQMEMRFTSDIQRGFSAFGFTDRSLTQLVTGYPPENLPCARSLWDNATPYDIDGNPYPNRPELPGQTVVTNATHASHYIMRNISITARNLEFYKSTQITNVTVMWAYMQSSMFNGGCYMGDLTTFTEEATYRIPLLGSQYQKANGFCQAYVGPVVGHRGMHKLSPSGPFFDGEYQQNNRVVALLFGGAAMLQSGQKPPVFASTGRVLGGEAGNGVCMDSVSIVSGRWFGFSDQVGGIASYVVSLGTIALPSYYVDRLNVGTNTFVSYPSTLLKKNTTLIIRVAAYNYANLFTAAVSKPIFVLGGGVPMFGTIADGKRAQLVDQQFTRSTANLFAFWDGWVTNEHSSKDYTTGVSVDNGFQYAVGEKGVAPDSVFAWTTVAQWRNDFSISGLTLTPGKTYQVSIRATNCAGSYTTQSTNGITVDTFPPLPGRVFIGNNTKTRRPLRSMPLSARLMAWWDSFVDVHSGIGFYEWAMGTTPHAPSATSDQGLIMGWNSVGLSTQIRNITLAKMPRATALPVPRLQVGMTIYVYVKAVDKVGNWMVSQSNGTKIVTN